MVTAFRVSSGAVSEKRRMSSTFVKGHRQSFSLHNGNDAKRCVREGSTFRFPPSVHGAVGAFRYVTLFYWKMNGGGTFRHRGRTTTDILRVINYSPNKKGR